MQGKPSYSVAVHSRTRRSVEFQEEVRESRCNERCMIRYRYVHTLLKVPVGSAPAPAPCVDLLDFGSAKSVRGKRKKERQTDPEGTN